MQPSYSGRPYLQKFEHLSSIEASWRKFATAVVCANLTGTHTIPAFVIAQYKNSQCLYKQLHMNTLPINFFPQKKSVEGVLHLNYVTHFLLIMEKGVQQQWVLIKRFLLIVDTAPCGQLKEQISVLFLRANIRSFKMAQVMLLNSAMDQGVDRVNEKKIPKNISA